MKRRQSILTVIALILVVVMLMPFAACGVSVSTIEMDATLSLNVGETKTLTPIVLPANATDKTLSWKSSDASVATVDADGNVTGVSEGTAIIRASAGLATATCTVTVTDPANQTILATGVTLSPSALRMNTGESATITPTVSPSNATDQSVTWTSSDTDKATVTQAGVVLALKAGTVTITATTTAVGVGNEHKSATAIVNIEGDDYVPPVIVDVTGVSLNRETMSLFVGDIGQLSATVEPEDATNKNVTWSTSNATVADVDENGNVEAKAKGTATITVTTEDGNKTATCQVTVSELSQNAKRVTGVTLSQNTLSMTMGDSPVQLTANVEPSDAENKNVTWSSNNTAVATVVDGKVTAVSGGTAWIGVKTSDGGFEDFCEVTVSYKAPSKVSVSPTSITLISIGETALLTATVIPSTASPNVTWTSSDDSIVTVSDQGVVKAISTGSATVTATSEDGSKSATCAVTVVIGSDTLYVAKVDSLSERSVSFIMGMDVSSVLSVEAARRASGAPLFKNFAGEQEDVFKILKDNGITDIRIRVWNDPKDTSGNTYGGGNCDVDNAVAIAERCAAVGLGVIIDFHYSDFWADPAKQTLPKAWKNYSTSQVAQAIYDFTEESLIRIKAVNPKITMVQVGNEINGGMAGTTNWTSNAATICNYINQGAAAVRSVTGAVANGGAKVAVHFASPGTANYTSYAGYLKTYSVDYDVFGSSFYTYYGSHGTLTNLANKLSQVHSQYGKEVMVLETDYLFTQNDFDGCGNTGLEVTPDYAFSVQGQANAVHDVIETVANLGDWGLGVCYWEGAWLAASTSTSGQTNRALCKQYGCGWATSYASGYDSDANDGGTMVDNRAFWSSTTGMPNESLKVFALVNGGTSVDVAADVYEIAEDYFTVGVGSITLPDTVTVTLNNGQTTTVAANWYVTDEELAEMIMKAGTYVIEGTTRYGGTCYFYAWVMNTNLLEDASFEDQTGYADSQKQVHTTMGPWNLEVSSTLTSGAGLYVMNQSDNARIGNQSFHFWDEGTVSFKLYQTIALSKIGTNYGTYGASFEFQGAAGDNIVIYAYIKLTYSNGETREFKDDAVNELQGYGNWQRTAVSGVTIDSSVTAIEVGISFYSDAESGGAGPWGNIDNCQFYLEPDED